MPGIIPLAVTAVPGSQTTIKRVAYSANGNPVGSSTESPFGFSWGLFTPGSYILTATSTTETGQTATSAPITVTAVGTPGAGLVTYFHQDLSGNTIAATDGAGNLLYRENYRPYGERLVKDSAAQIGNAGGNPKRPACCSRRQPLEEMCRDSREQVLRWLDVLEEQTRP